MKFSERLGFKEMKTSIQLKSMDDDLRNGLWNIFKIYFIDKIESDFSDLKIFFDVLWHDFYKLPIDETPRQTNYKFKFIRDKYFEFQWFEVYDFIEFAANIGIKPEDPYHFYAQIKYDEFIQGCNNIMEKEISGYRFINKKISPITDTNEISEIEDAIKNTSNSPVNIHLKAALDKLSDRKNPDYRNSIKESISAIESISQLISNDPKAELGKALKILKDKINLHGSLEQGFIKIYGYTSDSNGIRHALLEEPNVDFNDAKYMLVICSAFVNYLKMKAEKAGIKID